MIYGENKTKKIKKKNMYRYIMHRYIAVDIYAVSLARSFQANLSNLQYYK